MKKFIRILAVTITALILINIIKIPAYAADSFEVPSTPSATEDSATTAQTQTWPTPPEISTESVFLMEATTSTVFYEKASTERRYPASTTKILTCLLVLENCEMDEIVTFSERSVQLEEAATNIDATPGEEMTVQDLLYGLMLASGNDCANALAEHVAGSIEAFADMMNERAAAIGAVNSHFVNPHGLFDENHYTTAYDMALIAREAFQNEDFMKIIAAESYTMDPTNLYNDTRTFKNWNMLVRTESEYYDPDVIGGKTGYLDESGRCLVTYAQRDGMNVIMVQFKGPYNGIFTEAKSVLDFTFDNFAIKNLSQSESRFSKPLSGAKVTLDPSAQVITLKNITFEELTSSVIFSSDMTEEEIGALINSSKISDLSKKNLCGVINYSYAGHTLGQGILYTDSALKTASASFINIYYVNFGFILIFVFIILLMLAMSVGIFKKRNTPKRRRPNNRRRYSRINY